MKLLYSDITYQIRGACFWVWKEFGSAFKESIIDRALTEELRKRGLKVEDQKRIVYDQARNKDPRVEPRLRSACRSAGFTLIELLVAMAVFSIVILVVGASLTTALNSQRKALAVQNSQETIRYVLETMAKEIRMSNVNSLAGNSASLNITNPDNETFFYMFSENRLYRNDQPISPDNVSVTGSFYIIKSSFPERAQVTVAMKVNSFGSSAVGQAPINIQTTITPRGY